MDSSGRIWRFGPICDPWHFICSSAEREVIMQISDVLVLRKAWIEKGDSPYDHPTVEKEYYLGAHTGDDVCTTCGRVVTEHE